MSDILSNIQTVKATITSKNGKTVDVSQQFLLINIYQSLLHKKFISARIVLADTSDLLSNLPIIGNEEVNISVQNSYDSTTFNYIFKIYKIDRDVNTYKSVQKIKILNIYLYTSEENNSHTKISKRFTGTGETIIQTIVSDHLQSSKTIDSMPDIGTIDFVSNYWSYDRCIDYILRDAHSTYYDYLFFETNTGYHFKPLSDLFNQAIKTTLSFDISKEQFSNLDSILQYQFNSFFDDLMWRKKGMFGSTGYKLDFDSYTYTYKSENIEDIDERIFHDGANKIYSNQNDTLNRVYVTYDEDVVTRPTHFNLINRYNFVVNLNGDMSRNVGELYTIDFPSIDNESVSGSDSFSGNWLATEINTSIFQTNEVKQTINFSKNSLFNNYKLDKYN